MDWSLPASVSFRTSPFTETRPSVSAGLFLRLTCLCRSLLPYASFFCGGSSRTISSHGSVFLVLLIRFLSACSRPSNCFLPLWITAGRPSGSAFLAIFLLLFAACFRLLRRQPSATISAMTTVSRRVESVHPVIHTVFPALLVAPLSSSSLSPFLLLTPFWPYAAASVGQPLPETLHHCWRSGSIWRRRSSARNLFEATEWCI